jgi:hypothetical protein
MKKPSGKHFSGWFVLPLFAGRYQLTPYKVRSIYCLSYLTTSMLRTWPAI